MLDYMTHRVLVYQYYRDTEEGRALKEALINELCLHVYRFPGRRRSLGEEEWSDFLLSFYAKLHDIILNFHYQGPSFWGYLNKVLEWQLRSYYREEVKRKQCEWICERESIIDYEWNPAENDYCLYPKILYLLTMKDLTGYRVDAMRQRLLILLLKNAAFVREDEFLSLLPLLNVCEKETRRKREILLEGMERKFQRKNSLVMRRRENYYRYTLSEKRKADCADPVKLAWHEDRSRLYRKRLECLDEQIAAIPLVPSNEEIAGVLKIPKGSVDSGLYYLRNYLKTLFPDGACPDLDSITGEDQIGAGR